MLARPKYMRLVLNIKYDIGSKIENHQGKIANDMLAFCVNDSCR